MKDTMRRIGFVLAFTALSLLSVKDSRAQVYDFERMSHAIVNMLNAATDFIADNFETINTHNARVGELPPKGEPRSYKGINPEGFAAMIGREFTKMTGISIKFTSTGKGKYGPRNIYNRPDKWEAKQLEKFSKIKYPKGIGYGEIEQAGGAELYKMVYRYIYPLYIEHRCLKCHGDPARSPTGDGKDATGFEMENYKLGELRGAISLAFPID
ncbi:MAG: DUF3365 domain-containing protein [Candidatus Brocadiales bacterium]